MEHLKILNLLNEASDSKFITRNCNIVNDQSNENYCVGNEIIYSTEELKHYLYTYILVRGDITIIRHSVTQVAFKNCAPFFKGTTN